MLRFSRILTLTALAAFSTNSQAAGFDCQKAATFVEKAICQDQNLSALDEQLNSTFKIALAQSKNEKALKKQQSNWLKTMRNACQTNACLEKVYQARIAALISSATSTEDTRNPVKSLAAGTYLRYDENGKPDANPASLAISFANKGQVKIVGTSLWIGDPKTGNVHTGEVNGILTAEGDLMHYQDENDCHFILTFEKNALTVNNDNGHCGGVNVGFDGYYKKAK